MINCCYSMRSIAQFLFFLSLSLPTLSLAAHLNCDTNLIENIIGRTFSFNVEEKPGEFRRVIGLIEKFEKHTLYYRGYGKHYMLGMVRLDKIQPRSLSALVGKTVSFQYDDKAAKKVYEFFGQILSEGENDFRLKTEGVNFVLRIPRGKIDSYTFKIHDQNEQ